MDGVLSPASTGPSSSSPAGSAEFVGKSPRTTRRAHRRMRPVRVMETSVGDLPVCPGGGGLRLSASIAASVSGSA